MSHTFLAFHAEKQQKFILIELLIEFILLIALMNIDGHFVTCITLTFFRKMTLHPRNTQSDWMGEKEKTLKAILKDFGMEVVTKKYKVLQCFPQAVDPS